MFFWLKKLIGYWIMPVPAFVAIFAIGALLSWRKRTARAGRILVTIGAAFLFVLSNKWVSAHLTRPLETRYPAIPDFTRTTVPPKLAACKFVVVLGAGNGWSPGVASLDVLSVSARARITEAVRLLQALPNARLLVSGPSDEQGYATHATVLERTAISLGVDPARIDRIEHARDTEDEANAVKRRVGNAQVALVTSAWHMPRAAGLFFGAGVKALPCPTDYTTQDDGRFHWKDLLWDVESLERSGLAIREHVGYVWVTMRGKTGAAPEAK